MKFCFGDMVVVEENLIGVVVKSFNPSTTSYMGKYTYNEANHDVYVREYNDIKNYKESEMQRYMVRHKYLDEQELEWQSNAIKEFRKI